MSIRRPWTRSRRSHISLVILAFFVSSGVLGSTFVGNPTNVSLASMSGLVVTSLDIPLSQVLFGECGQQSGQQIDVEVVSGRLEFPVPEDTCWLEVTLDDSMLIDAHEVGGSRTVSLELSLPTFTVVLDEPFSPQNQSDRLVLELGAPNWTSKSALLPPGSPSVQIGPQDQEHATLVSELIDGTTLRYDTNGNGYIDGAERNASALGIVP